MGVNLIGPCNRVNAKMLCLEEKGVAYAADFQKKGKR